jgi:hypothetical protein
MKTYGKILLLIFASLFAIVLHGQTDAVQVITIPQGATVVAIPGGYEVTTNPVDIAQIPGFGGALSEIWNGLSSGTNWSFIGGYGRAANSFFRKDAQNVGFGDIVYGLNQNVGFIFGIDYLWAKGAGEFNTVKGGVNLQQPMRLFSWVGSGSITNTVATPFVSDCLAQPQGTANIGNLLVGGFNFNLFPFRNLSIDANIAYEDRMGQAQWNGGYWLFAGGITRRF